eukprot:7302454-Lingulodinium_polyedra.AAC.1
MHFLGSTAPSEDDSETRGEATDALGHEAERDRLLRGMEQELRRRAVNPSARLETWSAVWIHPLARGRPTCARFARGAPAVRLRRLYS